jgi:hypothetical protein
MSGNCSNTGAAMPTSGYPRVQDLDTHLVTEGRLCDGRRVRVTYYYTRPGAINRSIRIRDSMFQRKRFAWRKVNCERLRFHTSRMAVLDFGTVA